jgi:DNA primase
MLNSQTEEIKSKLDIVDVISEYIQLKQAGVNWKACCPFHNEKTPSFMVSREKQIWHCFGCGEGGDVFTFVQKIEGIEFPEALKILADKAGVKIKKLSPENTSQKTKLFELNRLALEFFHKALLASKEGEIARNYLAGRNLTKETIKDFKLGYAPNSWDILSNFLIKKGYNQNEILLAGLAVKNEKGQIYDRFRQRLMFPIPDHHGNAVGFTGRILDTNNDKQGGKYINTPQTLVYNKSLIIYGLDQAKEEIKKQNSAIIVEGNMDVIASHQAGIKNVVASSGTALTLEQLKLLHRYSNNLALCFDMDLAGQTAAERGIDIALSLGLNIKIIQLPAQIENQPIKDPDDCIKKGVKYWQEAINNSASIMDFYFTKIFSQFDLKDPLHKKEIAAKLLKQIAKLIDKVEQDYWLVQLAHKLDVPENILRETLNKFLDKKKEKSEDIIIEKPKEKNRENLLAEQLLALIIKYPKNIKYVIDHLELEAITDSELAKIYKELILLYNNSKSFDYSEFEKILLAQDEKLVNLLSTLMLLADKDFLDFSEEKANKEILEVLKHLKREFINKKLRQLQKLLNLAEKEKNEKQIETLSKEFSVLTEQLNNL